MAAKYFHSLADENPDFKKQIGCMNGVFQVFNRHHIVSRRRGGHSDTLFFNNGTPERESSFISGRPSNVEKHRISTESSKDSFSSWSPQSPFSYNNTDYKSQQNLDLRDVVKDSMYREARGLSLSHKTKTKTKNKSVVELGEEANWYCVEQEPKELCRSKSCHNIKGTHAPFSISNKDYHVDLPRLSLDSKERCMRTLSSVSLVPVINNKPCVKVDCPIPTRPPSVVAKLMGLETFPISKITPDKKKVEKSRVPCVYSEVDKRLKNLEFSQSGKDLRALKQILEAMHAVEAKKCEKQDSVNASISSSNIVVMKPATKVVGKRFVNNKDNNKSGKDVITKPRKESVNRRRRRRQSLNTDSRELTFRESQTSKKSNGDTVLEHSEESNTQEESTLLVKVGESLTSEYPSPVSVLDDSIYVDNSPSPVKCKLNTQKDDATENCNEEIVEEEEHNEATNVVASSPINHEKLKKVENLVRKLKSFNSNHDEFHTDYIAFLCENTNTNANTNLNDRYISEIFLASGLLLQDLESFNFHSSGYPINPNLFLVLEHTKFRTQTNEKFHRKLIFDAVNEILVEKLNSVSSSSSSRKFQNPKKLLKELCVEIEQKLKKEGEGDDDLKRMLSEDVLNRSENWMGFRGENPVIVVEVERLIFRDLVNELVMSEVSDVMVDAANSYY